MSLPSPFFSGPFQQPFDSSVYTFWEDFTSCAPSVGSIGAATSVQAEHRWSAQQVGANAAATFRQANTTDGIHLGACFLTPSNTSTGNGICLYLGGGNQVCSYFNPNATPFVYKTAFQLGQNTNVAIYCGLALPNSQNTIANANTVQFLGLRYDTSAPQSDANLFFISQTAGAVGNTWVDSNVRADTAWHKLTISGSGQGTVSMQLDNNAPVSINTIPSVFMDYGLLMLVSRGAGNPIMNVDYIGVQLTGLSR